jgi:hypothetical protein
MEEGRRRTFENKMRRRIFGSKRNDVTGKWRKLHKDKLYDIYYS